MVRGGQIEAKLLDFGRKKFMGQLDQNPGAIPGLRIRANSAPMLEIAKNLQPVFDDLAAPLIADRADHANAAGVMLVGRVIKPLGRTLAGIKAVTFAIMDSRFGHS